MAYAETVAGGGTIEVKCSMPTGNWWYGTNMSGNWEDWVKLAKNILARDAEIKKVK